jgi:hypothetical protein
MRCGDELVAVLLMLSFPVVAYQVAYQRAFRMPEHEALTDLVAYAEQVKLLSDDAVVCV